jgi:ABC-type transporter Mla MlaB component
MLRITVEQASGELVMKVEGAMTRPWVEPTASSWQEVTSRLGGWQVHVDLRGVCRVDEAGMRLLEAMHRAGARFVTSGCLMPEVLREIAEGPRGRSAETEEFTC